MKTLKEIQNEVITKYNVTIDEHSHCYGRMHVHTKTRRICKWHQKSSLPCTFDLFHEIGHIMTNNSKMRRAEEEYFATCWAIDQFKHYGLTVPEHTMHVYQRYILQTIARGKRRGGGNYGEINIYKYAGINKTIEEFKKELDPRWAKVINDWV